MILTFPNVTVDYGDGRTITTFVDGTSTCAPWEPRPEQFDTAAEFQLDPHNMNQHHDLMHTILAIMMGLPYSPVLWATAHGYDSPTSALEERAVLSFQSYAAAHKIEIEQLAIKVNSDVMSKMRLSSRLQTHLQA